MHDADRLAYRRSECGGREGCRRTEAVGPSRRTTVGVDQVSRARTRDCFVLGAGEVLQAAIPHADVG